MPPTIEIKDTYKTIDITCDDGLGVTWNVNSRFELLYGQIDEWSAALPLASLKRELLPPDGTTSLYRLTGNAADDQVLLGSGASAATWASVADCNTNNRDRVQYDTATNAFSCDTDTLLDADVDDTITVGNGGTVDADALACDVGDDNLISEDCIGANILDTTEIAGLDIGDDTNLTAGRSLTLTGDDVLADAELYTDTKNINITSPGTGVTNLVQFTFALPATIGQVVCSVDTGTLTIQFDERAQATPNTAGTNIMTSSLVCDTNSQVTAAFDNAAIAADAPVNLQVTAASGTPRQKARAFSAPAAPSRPAAEARSASWPSMLSRDAWRLG